MMLLTDIQEGNKFRLYLLQLLSILLICIFQMFEDTPRVYVVTGVNTYLLTILGGNVSNMRREMHVGNQRCVVTFSLQTC